MDETLLDFGIVCLVCLCTKEKFNSIFNNDPETPEMQIYEKIACCTNIELPENVLQKVPHKICTICLLELGTTWRFRKKCEAANKIFQSMLKPDIEAEEMVKLTLEEHKLKLPPGIKVKCVNSTMHPQTITKMPIKKIGKPKASIDQENLPHLPMSSSSSNLNEEESHMNAHPLNLSPSHSGVGDGVEDGDNGDGLDFGNISNVCELISIDMEGAEDSGATQHIEYVYDAEYFDDSNDNDALSIPMSPSRDGREDPSVIVSIAEHTNDHMFINEDDFTPPTNPEPVLMTEIRAFDGSQAKQSKTRQMCSNRIKKVTNDITTRSKTSATFQSVQPVQQRETKPQKQNKKTNKNDNKKNTPSSTVETTNDDKNKELSSTSKRKGGRPKSCVKAQVKICNQCGNTYKYQHALKAHMRRHSNERPFPCEVCDKAFVSNVELRRHMRVHTGQKPYGCQFCSRRFSDFGSSKKHERIHTGERPYVCEVCFKGFAYAHVLTEHRRIHTGNKKYPCPHCAIGFTKKIYLQAHEKYKCKQRLPNNRVNKEHGYHRSIDNMDIIDGLTGMNDTNMDILHDGDGDVDDMRSVFEDNKVLEECIVESEFIISDSLDNDYLPHPGHGTNESDEGGSGSGGYPLVINTEFPEGDNTE